LTDSKVKDTEQKQRETQVEEPQEETHVIRANRNQYRGFEKNSDRIDSHPKNERNNTEILLQETQNLLEEYKKKYQTKEVEKDVKESRNVVVFKPQPSINSRPSSMNPKKTDTFKSPEIKVNGNPKNRYKR